MKSYSIGRDPSCDIPINDSSDVISRRHAVLNATDWGKYTIVDSSTNGTYVNGIRIHANVPVPVTRKDRIKFAKIAQLDWNRIPKSYTMLRTVLFSLASLLVVACLAFGIIKWMDWREGKTPKSPVEVTDTVTQQAPDTTKKEEPKQPADSVNKKAPASPKPATPKDGDKQENDTTKNQKPEEPKNRPIG